MSEHTPGPWKAVRHGSTAGSIVCDIGRALEIVRSDGGETHNEAIEADARLIAAAPDLLAACEALLEQYPIIPWADTAMLKREWLEDTQAQRLALEAIAKAHGEEK